MVYKCHCIIFLGLVLAALLRWIWCGFLPADGVVGINKLPSVEHTMPFMEGLLREINLSNNAFLSSAVFSTHVCGCTWYFL